MASSGMGIVGIHPGIFCKSGKQRSCRIRRMGERARVAGKGLMGVAQKLGKRRLERWARMMQGDHVGW